MKVLIACEYSGIIRNEFLKKDHDCWSCDLLPTENNADKHYQCDIREVINDSWEMIIFHPDCTRLCNSGVRWLHERNLWGELKKACQFFRLAMDSNCEKVVTENPIPHKYAIELIGEKYNQIIQPWNFGDNESKAFCFWLKNVDLLVPEIVERPENVKQSVWKMTPGKDRSKERARMFPGIARAMAEQWG